jgi:hypothetical protein
VRLRASPRPSGPKSVAGSHGKDLLAGCFVAKVADREVPQVCLGQSPEVQAVPGKHKNVAYAVMAGCADHEQRSGRC